MMPKGYKGRGMAVLVAGCLVALLCTGGCTTTGEVGAAGGKTPVNTGLPDVNRSVVVDRHSMRGGVEIIGMESSVSGDLLQVKLSMRIAHDSRDPDMVPLEYRFFWFDENGMGIPVDTEKWEPLIIFGRETLVIQRLAPDPRARQFRLLIRGPGGDHC